MAGDPFQPVFPGQKLEIPAPAYNAFLDAARAQRDRLVDSGRDPRVDSRQSGIIKIRNDSGSDRGRFDVLGIAGPMIYPSEDLDEFQSRVAFAGVTPRDVHRGRFVVLMEPLEDGAIGRAVVAGIAPVRLQNSPDQPPTSLAEMIPDSTLALRVDPHGSAQILWREESTSSLTWAVVRLLGPPASGMVYVLDPCASGDGEAILVGNDLGAWLGRVVKVNGICYYVRRPQPGEFDCGIPSCVSVEAHYADCKRCNGCWELTPCASGTIIQSQTDLAAYEDMIVRLADGNCYTVGLAEECIDPVPVSVVASYSICEACHSCYHLVNCHDPGDTRAIGNDLARLQGIEPAEVLGTVVEIDGACYQVLTYDDSCGDAEIVAIQAAHEDCEACGCFQLTACAGAPPTVIHVRDATGPGGSLALSDYVGQIVRLSDGVCYQVQPSSECEDLVSVEVIEAYADCESCACWELTACDDPGEILLTYSDLSSHAIGTILREVGSERCWNLIGAAAWSASAVAFEVAASFPECAACLGTVLYRLTPACPTDDCGTGGGDGSDEILTNEPLHAAVGKYVKIDGRCYQASVAVDGVVTHSSLNYRGPFATCAACNAAPIEARKLFITSLRLDGTNLVATSEEMIIRDGRVVGFCPAAEFVIEGTDCPEP